MCGRYGPRSSSSQRFGRRPGGGTAAPVVGERKIEFNGRGKLARQPFVFPGEVDSEDYSSCMTFGKPYGAAVAACLLVARDHFPSGQLLITSDDTWGNGDWRQGARLYQQVFGKQPDNPTSWSDEDFSQPPDQPTEDMGLVARLFLAAIGLAIVWWIVRPHYAFVLFVEGCKLDRVRGSAPRSFLLEVDDICRQMEIPRGTIRALRVRQWTRLIFSREIPPDVRQRIRNIWCAQIWRQKLGR